MIVEPQATRGLGSGSRLNASPAYRPPISSHTPLVPVQSLSLVCLTPWHHQCQHISYVAHPSMTSASALYVPYHLISHTPASVVPVPRKSPIVSYLTPLDFRCPSAEQGAKAVAFVSTADTH